VAFVEKDTSALKLYLANSDGLPDNKEYLLSYKILKRDSCITNSTIQYNEFFNQLVTEYYNYKKKSPFTAAILSSVIPGLGKFYLGYKYQARSSLFINIVLGLVLAESVLVPVSALYTGFCITTSSVFYIGNIWGSALLAKKRDRDFYNQINEDISNYYYHKLYP
jgi:TM2 domain-containing membrane protein YozV